MTEFQVFWEAANALLRSWDMDALRCGPARDYFEAGITPEQAADKERDYQAAKRVVKEGAR